MLTLAAALMLSQGAFVPAHATLLGSAPDRAERASLLTEAPLPGTGVLLAQAAPPTPPPGQVAGPSSVQELRAERLRLSESRPSLGAGIGMLASGVVLCLAGAVVAVYGAALAFSGLYAMTIGTSSVLGVLTVVGFVLLGVGVVALAVGIPLAIVGGVKLSRTLRERSAIGKQMDEIDERIRQLEEATPPPPPTPMSVERARAGAALVTVASF